MSFTQPEERSVAQHNQALDSYLKSRWAKMDIKRWRLLQSTAITLIISLLGYDMGADPNLVILGILAINGVLISDLVALSESINITVDDEKSSDDD